MAADPGLTARERLRRQDREAGVGRMPLDPPAHLPAGGDRGMTPRELARVLRVSPDRVRAWIASGELGAYLAGEIHRWGDIVKLSVPVAGK